MFNSFYFMQFCDLISCYQTHQIHTKQRISSEKKLARCLIAALTAEDLPQPVVCGNYVTPNIFGGEQTEITEFPWMALVEHVTRIKLFCFNQQILDKF